MHNVHGNIEPTDATAVYTVVRMCAVASGRVTPWFAVQYAADQTVLRTICMAHAKQKNRIVHIYVTKIHNFISSSNIEEIFKIASSA